MVTTLFYGVFKRDLALAFRQKAELAQPLLFLLIVITLFPIAVGPGPDILQRIGPGVIWVAAILASLLGMDRLFKEDFNDGSLEQMMLSGHPLYQLVLAKITAHWLVCFIPVLLLTPLFSILLNQTLTMAVALFLSLLLGTPLLSLMAAIAMGLTVGVPKGGLLPSLLMLPVLIPLLIFATSAVESAAMGLSYTPQLAVIGAMFLVALALAPLATVYALKVSQH